MSDQLEQFGVNYYFNGHVIIRRINDASRNFGFHLNADSLSYLVNATWEEKRKAFRAFIAGDEGLAAMDAFLDVMLWARFVEEQERIENSIIELDELLTSYLQNGWLTNYLQNG